MSLLGLIILLAIAAVAGMIGQALAGYSVGGCFLSAVIGLIGAFIGMWLARQLGLPEPFPISIEGETYPILWSVLGSALFAAVLGLISRRGRVV